MTRIGAEQTDKMGMWNRQTGKLIKRTISKHTIPFSFWLHDYLINTLKLLANYIAGRTAPF